jgi:predicted phosphodiesterase
MWIIAVPVALGLGYLYARRQEQPCPSNSVKYESSVDNMHTHTLCVPQLTPDQLLLLPKQQLVTSKDFGHTHNVLLTPEQLAVLVAGTPVQVRSSVDFNHSHTFNLGK